VGGTLDNVSLSTLKETAYLNPSQHLWQKVGFALRLNTDIPLSPFISQPLFFSPFSFRDPANNSEFQYEWNINKIHVWYKHMTTTLDWYLVIITSERPCSRPKAF